MRAVSRARGDFFSVGGALAESDDGYLFGFNNGLGTQQLVVGCVTPAPGSPGVHLHPRCPRSGGLPCRVRNRPRGSTRHAELCRPAHRRLRLRRWLTRNRCGRGSRSCRSSSSRASTTGCTPSSPTSSSASRRTCGWSAPAPTGWARTSRSSREDGTALHETRPALPLAGEWTLAGFCDHLATLELWPRAAGVGRGAALPQLGVRVGGARPRAAPGRPPAARRARARAAAGALRQLARASASSRRSSRCAGGSPAPRACASSSTRRRPGRRRSSTRSRRPARSTRSTSRASTASRSRIRRRWSRCTTACSRRSRTRYLEDPHDLPEIARAARRSRRARLLRRADPQRRGHRRDAAARARGERQAVAHRQPARAVRGLRALRAGAAADVRRRHGRAGRRPRADRAARRAVPRRRAQRRGAERLQRGRPAGRACRPARWHRAPTPPASAGRRSVAPGLCADAPPCRDRLGR